MTIPTPDRNVTLVLSGSFNPVTVLHLRICETAREALKARGVKVTKCIISPVHDKYTKESLIPGTHRLAMARLAVTASKSEDWLEVSDWECSQEAWTRTLPVLEHFQEIEDALGKEQGKVGNQVMLVIGADVLETLLTTKTWKSIDEIILNHGIVSIVRGSGSAMQEIVDKHVQEDMRPHIILANDGVVNNVSSSIVRTKVARGESIKYLVLDSVIKYIADHGLYREDTNAAV